MMTMRTDKQLKKMARDDYMDCRECGHFPEFVCGCSPSTDEELKQYADEYEMTTDEFKKYMDYFMELCVQKGVIL